LTVQRLLGEFGENAKLDRAKENFGRHEPESDLLDSIRARLCAHRSNPKTKIYHLLRNGGTLEHAQQIAAHESPRTTKLYDRTSDQVSVDRSSVSQSKALHHNCFGDN
jgi:hypothetical protein